MQSSAFVGNAPSPLRGIYPSHRSLSPLCPPAKSLNATPRPVSMSSSEKPSPSGGRKGGKDKKAGETPRKGLFGRLKDTVMRPIVTVPGGGQGGDLLECVFCKGNGVNDCDACLGSGKDALGQCFMCDGKTYLTCTVCNGVGTVDRIRRGGTDDRNEYIKARKK